MNRSKCLLMRLALIIGFIAQCALLQASTLIDGLYYDLDMSTRTATVTYEKNGTDNYASLPANVKIPESVEYNGVTYSVTKVANKAFANCKSLESISIPGTVVQIGISSTNPSYLPFYNCTTLKNVKFEDGAQSLFLSASYSDNRAPSSEAKGLFEDCPLEEVYIGRNISYIDSYVTFEEEPNLCDFSAFYKQTKLTKALISSSVTAIPKYLFYRCSALSDVDIQGQLVEIPFLSFAECNLSALKLPNSIEEINEYAFQNNKAMTSAVLGDNVKSIGSFAFSGCSNLTNLDLGNSLVSIGDYAFQSIGSNANTGLNVVFPNTLSTIGNGAFRASGISSITIPNSVTRIGRNCFANNTKLEKITIGNGCRELPEGIFSDCLALTSVVLNDGLEKISNKAFANCQSLESISIPGTIVQIGETYYDKDSGGSLPFYNCTTLKNVRFEDGTKELVLGVNHSKYTNVTGTGIFSYCPLEEVYIGRNISYSKETFEEDPNLCAYSTFYNQTKLTKAVISSSVTEIPVYLFYGCSALSNVSISDRLVKIPAHSFDGCNLSALTLPNSIEEINEYAFRNNKAMTSAVLGNNVKTIGRYTFQNCSSLANIDLGNSLVTIYNGAFSGCKSLKSISIPGTVVQIGGLSEYDENKSTLPFYNCTSLKEVRFENGDEPLSICAFTEINRSYNSKGGYTYYPVDSKNNCGLFVSCPIEYVYIGSI